MDKDNRDVCGLSAVEPRPNFGLASALCSRMLPRCPGWAWLNRSCLAGTVVGLLVPMVRLRVRAQARAKRRYRLLSCLSPSSAVAAEVEQLGAALGCGAASAAPAKLKHYRLQSNRLEILNIPVWTENMSSVCQLSFTFTMNLLYALFVFFW